MLRFYSYIRIRELGLCSLAAFCLMSCSTSKVTKPGGYSLSSPNGRITVDVAWSGSATPTYAVKVDGKDVLLPSEIDLQIGGFEHHLRSMSLVDNGTVDDTWSLPWGQFSDSHDHYNYAEFRLQDALADYVVSHIEFRVFDDAIAFRHDFKDSTIPDNRILLEVSDFNFATDAKTYSYLVEHDPKVINSINAESENMSIPVLIETDTLPAMAIQEAAVIETAPISLKTVPGSSMITVESAPIFTSEKLDHTAWRVLQIGEHFGDLITAQTLINLSPPSRIEDTSWIKPGKSFWDWRVRGAEYGDHTYGIDYESLSRMIDFSSENGMQHVMIDANWYGKEHLAESDPFTDIEGLKLKELIQKANDVGIGFILYLNDAASINHDLDTLFETWSSWGASGIKYGFMIERGANKTKKTLEIVRLAAKHELLINFHDGPIVPSGLRRTYPNWVTREAVHAQTDSGRNFDPSGFVEMAHVSGVMGPIDMSNGFFQIDGLPASRSFVRQELYSTVASEVARTLIIFSGLTILPDAPEEYTKKIDLFDFLDRMPVTWDESSVLSSDIESHIVTARRSGKEWFVGAVINEKGGTLPLNLDFLESGVRYKAKVFADTSETHYKLNREAYMITEMEVSKNEVIDMILAPGGGQALIFTPMQ